MKNKKIYLALGLAIIFILFLASAFFKKQGVFGSPSLEFAYGTCSNSKDPYSQLNPRIEASWIAGDTLQVKTQISINCLDEIKGGDFEVVGDKILLKYTSSDCSDEGSCAKCVCSHELIYKIKNLKKGEYKFELVKI